MLINKCFPALLLMFAGQVLAQQPTPAAVGRDSLGRDAFTTKRDTLLGQSMLRPGDVIRLRIRREPDLSGEFPVDERGMAVFPKIGATHVDAITADSLHAMLVAEYSQYLRDPAVEVTFLRRVTVLGAVNHPGIYPVDPTMTIHDAFALAGGTLPNGNPNKFSLRRNGQQIEIDFATDTPIGKTSIRSGDELYVPERSWFSRNGVYVVGAAITATAIIVAQFVK